MAMENTVRAQSGGAFRQRDMANNAARARVLQEIAGTDADMAAAEAARESATSSLRNRAFAEGAGTALQAQQARALMLPQSSSVDQLRRRVGQIAANNASRPSVQSAISDVSRALNNAGDSVGSLYNVRQYIGDLLSGKAGGDKGYAQAASKELMQVRELLDTELSAMAPSFPEYLNAFRTASKPINRMEVGGGIINRASSSVPDELGVRTITPSQFSRVTNDLDAIAAKATGFSKAKATDILEPSDIANLQAIQDDMSRQFSRQTSAATGSQTAERLAIGSRIAKRGAVRAVPVLRDVAEFFEQQADQRLRERLAYLVANPQEAKRVINALSEKDKPVVRNAIMALSSRSGVIAPTLTE